MSSQDTINAIAEKIKEIEAITNSDVFINHCGKGIFKHQYLLILQATTSAVLVMYQDCLVPYEDYKHWKSFLPDNLPTLKPFEGVYAICDGEDHLGYICHEQAITEFNYDYRQSERLCAQQRAEEEKAKISPFEMFRGHYPGHFFDDRGIPRMTPDMQQLPSTTIEKLEQAWDGQYKRHKAWLDRHA